MKKFTAVLLVIMFALMVAGCRGGNNASESGGSSGGSQSTGDVSSSDTGQAEPEEAEYSFIPDKNYEKGFGVTGMDARVTGGDYLGFFTYGGTVDAEHEGLWHVGQWSGKSDLAADYVETKLADGVYDYRAGGKHVVVDTNEGKLTLGIDAELEYDEPRKPGGDWVHNIVGVDFISAMNIDDCEHIYAKMKFTIDKCDRKMTNAEFNGNIHNAQLLWYLTVTNRPENTIYDNATGEWSRGRYGEFLWFGLPLWEANHIETAESSAYDVGTSSYIYGMGNRNYLNVPVEVGDENEFKIDILPYMRRALLAVQEKGGLKNATFDNMYVGYMNLGWEVPGIFNVQATFDYVDVTYVPKAK